MPSQTPTATEQAPAAAATGPQGRELEGQTFIVTGANSGVGRTTAGTLARRGAHVFLGCRTAEKAELAAASLRAQLAAEVPLPMRPALQLDTLELDLSQLDSVRRAAEVFLDRGLPLHGLINNAGVAGVRALTRDGFELTFGVNHLGHFLLTRLLEERLSESAPSRVVNVASEAHRNVTGIDFTALRQPARSRTGLREYGVSKLCNVLFTRELARRWAGTGITVHAVHPGVVATGIWRRVPPPVRWLITRFMMSPEQGARTTVFCATAPELAGVSGRYYDRQRETPPSSVAQDDALAARLWVESETFVGLS